MGKQFGNYLDDSSDFCIHTADIPRNWYNYLWNDRYVTFTSQTCAGSSLLQDDMGNRLKLVEDRGFFLLEEGDSWGIGGLPVGEKRDDFRCVHRRGASDLYTEKNGILSTVSIIVPRDLFCELWRVRVENKSDRTREVKVLTFFNTQFDGKYARQGYNTTANCF